MGKKNALGKGLGALISDAPSHSIKEYDVLKNQPGNTEILLSEIEANPDQPRTKFDEEALQELADSIKMHGVIQPVTLREIGDGKYQIISGERRVRASRIAGLIKVPAFIRKTQNQEMLTLALLENIQREDLDAIEVAISFQRLVDECNLTQEQLSERVGKKRATVANYLRLLRLPAEIQLGIINSDISMGHAKVLVSIDDNDKRLKIYKTIIEKDLTVRQAEALSKKEKSEKKTSKSSDISPEYKVLQEQISKKLNTNVKFKRNENGKGEIVIPFATDEELEKIISLFE